MKLKENDTCTYCKEGKLKYVPEDEPWSMEHLQCEKCDSTYNLFDENQENSMDGVEECFG